MKRNRKRKKLNNIMIISVCAVLLLMTAGYAAMQTNLGINAKGNVVKKGMSSEEFIDSIPKVTEGDGLYKDSYEDNVYTYRGANPNNYVTFNGEQWRIISVNTADNTIKIMRNAVLSDRAFDTSSNGRYNSSQYCNYSNGCNIYGSTSTLYDTNLSPITTLGRTYNGTKYQLPSKESEMSTYLNGTYYNGLNEKVALIDATEYVRASTYSSCTSVYQGYQSSAPCKNSNWMFNSDIWWTLSPYSDSDSYAVWYVHRGGAFYIHSAYNSYGVRPVLTLNSNIQITGGTGTSSSPYTLGA